jgi:uncharacterized DUF497 family protein
MDFEWDEAKRQTNLRARGVDFEIAARIFEGPVVVAMDDRHDYGEERYRAIGKFEEQTYVVVFAIRGEVRRIISARKVDRAGERRYQALLSRRPSGQA